jgi:ATP-dependent DNA helicase RecG
MTARADGGSPSRAAVAAVTELAGVGPARAALLERLGVRTVPDMALLLPRRYDRIGPLLPVEQARERIGAPVTLRVRVVSRNLLRRGGRRSLLRVRVEDDTSSMNVLFFNQPWQRDNLQPEAEVELQGNVVETPSGPALAAPRIGSEERALPAPGSLVPVYPATDGLGQLMLRQLALAAVELAADSIEEPLTDGERERLALPTLGEAVRTLHVPPDEVALEPARRRVALEGMLGVQARLARARPAGRQRRPPAPDAAALWGLLPFEPTAAQRRALGEVLTDMEDAGAMRRLLQGDVGAGKTAVGLLACVAAARAGGQAALLAPTELLAEQHLRASRAVLEAAGLRAVLLTGSLTGPERRKALRALERGDAAVAVGTHALLGEAVKFKGGLRLAVIDEQQRFGVAQRERLLDKGRDVDVLLMTATPIPRTLALTLYGELAVSLIDELPAGRAPRRTFVRPTEARPLVEEQLAARLDAGERAYWVAPRIEGEEPSVLEAHARLAASPAGRHGVELVHGGLEAPERESALERFRTGRSRLLVATTVIEVGVDVPEATVLVVEGANGFGLAQLHQLRGRVGRGGRPSDCVLLADDPEALDFLEGTDDGFAIAEEDLARRGKGELAGARQSGDPGDCDPALDLDLLVFARDLMTARPELAERYAPDGARHVGSSAV